MRDGEFYAQRVAGFFLTLNNFFRGSDTLLHLDHLMLVSPNECYFTAGELVHKPKSAHASMPPHCPISLVDLDISLS